MVHYRMVLDITCLKMDPIYGHFSINSINFFSKEHLCLTNKIFALDSSNTCFKGKGQ